MKMKWRWENFDEREIKTVVQSCTVKIKKLLKKSKKLEIPSGKTAKFQRP